MEANQDVIDERTIKAPGDIHVGPDVTDEQLDQVDAAHDADDAGNPLPDPKDPVVTNVRCEKCTTKASWVGALTDDMLERTFKRGVDEATGLPNCPHCGTPMTAVELLTAPDAIAKVAQQLDQERAGEAAKPLYQPSIPGVHPPFDFRRAQMQTESLEENAAEAKSTWESAKEEAAARKKDYDESVSALCKHIEQMKRQRQEAEYQQGRGASFVHEIPGQRQPCPFEVSTGQPCRVCRGEHPPAAELVSDIKHVADMLLQLAAQELDTLGAEAFVKAIATIAGIEIEESAPAAWSGEDRLAVAEWLYQFAEDVDRGEPGFARPIPLAMGRFHEAAEASGELQACRICGATLKRFTPEAVAAGLVEWPAGQKVGTDCQGEPAAEPAPVARPRHAKRSDAVKAKQAGEKAAAAEKAPKKGRAKK